MAGEMQGLILRTKRDGEVMWRQGSKVKRPITAEAKQVAQDWKTGRGDGEPPSNPHSFQEMARAASACCRSLISKSSSWQRTRHAEEHRREARRQLMRPRTPTATITRPLQHRVSREKGDGSGPREKTDATHPLPPCLTALTGPRSKRGGFDPSVEWSSGRGVHSPTAGRRALSHRLKKSSKFDITGCASQQVSGTAGSASSKVVGDSF
ncbi:unnamed protein product [Pleuronectes platessa]|uniref:Uncharacterized protein n=1 Tax=Pleuronectes platessa TaxID=8262 RepID=A0A9N7YU94_PLEPL|nr:unnamed protein product [Pleuronectes platessa]